jgi:hypothetical protein
LENHAAAVAAKVTPVQTSWSSTVTAKNAAQNPAFAQGAPDSSSARLDQTANADDLNNSGLSFADPTGTIIKVEFLFNGYLSQPLTDDQVDVSIGGALFTTLTTAQLNAMTGPAVIHAVEITTKNASWTWLLVNALTGTMKTNKTSAGDPGGLWVDSMGFRVTTTATAPPTGTYEPSTIDPLPLVDTYDSTKLQYVSTSVNAGTTAWSNLGPLNPGTRKTITVTFLALTPPDINSNGTQDIRETGIAGVTVELYLDVDQDGLPDSPSPIATTVTADGTGANPAGFYQFIALAAGTDFVKVLTRTLPLAGGLPIPLTSDPDCDGVPVNDNTYPRLPAGDNGDSLVIVSLGSNDTGADFGYQPPGVIGDFVWLDLDQDGVQDLGEPGIVNVTVGTLSSNIHFCQRDF